MYTIVLGHKASFIKLKHIIYIQFGFKTALVQASKCQLCVFFFNSVFFFSDCVLYLLYKDHSHSAQGHYAFPVAVVLRGETTATMMYSTITMWPYYFNEHLFVKGQRHLVPYADSTMTEHNWLQVLLGWFTHFVLSDLLLFSKWSGTPEDRISMVGLKKCFNQSTQIKSYNPLYI